MSAGAIQFKPSNPLSLSAPLPSNLSVHVPDFQYRTGDRVLVHSKKIGTVKYVGKIEGTSGKWTVHHTAT